MKLDLYRETVNTPFGNNFAVLGLSFSGGHLAATFLSHDIYRQHSSVQHAASIAASMSFAINVTPDRR